MMLPLVQAPNELKCTEQEGLLLAREVMGNADGAIPDSIVLERSSLDNGGGLRLRVYRKTHMRQNMA